MQQREKGKGKKQTHFKINFPFVDFDERKFFQPELNLKKKKIWWRKRETGRADFFEKQIMAGEHQEFISEDEQLKKSLCLKKLFGLKMFYNTPMRKWLMGLLTLGDSGSRSLGWGHIGRKYYWSKLGKLLVEDDWPKRFMELFSLFLPEIISMNVFRSMCRNWYKFIKQFDQ